MKQTLLAFLLSLVFSFSQAQLTSISNFGSDPGNLNMYIHVPSNMPSNAPLVLVMHGCLQSASSYSNESDWNALADEFKFYVIFAEQPNANNSSECFNWFEAGDNNRGFGEAQSLKSMVDYMKNNYSINNDRVFVTGFSAGGAMATVMLGAYPDVFSSGAVMSGLPYDVASGSTQAFQAMFGNVNLSPSQLGNRVRNASSHTGPWPTVSIFHGTSDFTVYYMNETEVMEQWTNVHGIDQTPELDDPAYLGNGTVRKREYHDGSGNPLVISYSFDAMGHTIAIDPGSGPAQGGNAGSYTKDVNFWSSYYAAEFFGLLGPGINPPSDLTATAISSSAIDLSWTDNETNETGYVVQRANVSGGPYATIASLSTDATSYRDGSLSPATTYYYQVVVETSEGSANSDQASATTFSIPGSGPVAPSNLSATLSGSTTINLNWQDNSSDEDNFILERSIGDESNYSVLATVSANTTNYSDGSLANSTTYYYRVKAQNMDGDSPYAPSANATTAGEATIVTIEQPNGSGIISYLNLNDMGQSFTSIADGELVEVEVNLVNSISGSSLKIFSGNTVFGTPIYEQTGISAGSGWQTISLSSPVVLSDGQQYTFQITNASIKYTFSNAYSGGNFWYNNISYTVFDAAFKVSISTTNPGARVETVMEEPVIEDSQFEIWPNPAQSFLNVSLDESDPNALLEFISVEGKTCYAVQVNDLVHHQVSVSSLAPGMYHVVLSTKNTRYVRRVIIN